MRGQCPICGWRASRHWVRTFGLAQHAKKDALDDSAVDLAKYAVEATTQRLLRDLDDLGALRLTPIEHRVGRSLFENQVAFLAECRALVLRMPNPMPEVVLFPRLAWVTARLHRLGAAIRRRTAVFRYRLRRLTR